MRYFASDMRKPSSWREDSRHDERTIMDAYFYDNIKMYDADNCGNETVYFAFSTGKYFRLDYSWYWDWDESSNMEWVDNVEIAEITQSETKGLCADRDWLVLKAA